MFRICILIINNVIMIITKGNGSFFFLESGKRHGPRGACRDVERVSVHCAMLIRSALLAPGQTGGPGKFSLNTAHCLNISACQSVTPSPDKSRLVLLNQQWGGSAGRKITRAYFSLSPGRRKPLSTSTSYNCLNYHKNHRRAHPRTCLCSPAGVPGTRVDERGREIAACFQL